MKGVLYEEIDFMIEFTEFVYWLWIFYDVISGDIGIVAIFREENDVITGLLELQQFYREKSL